MNYQSIWIFAGNQRLRFLYSLYVLLNQVYNRLQPYFKANPLSTAKEARDRIAARHGESYSVSGARRFLQRLGFRVRKPRPVPRLADEDAQQTFIEAYQELKQTLPADEVIVFFDAVHPAFNVRPTCGWFPNDVRPAVKTSTGRRRVNVLGAIDPSSGRFVGLDVKRANGTTLERLLDAVVLEFGNEFRHIHLFLDNARYNHSPLVRCHEAVLAERVELHYLPPYAPHLNPIERLWRVMHKHVTHNRWYTDFQAFKARIWDFFNDHLGRHWHEIKTTVTDNFGVLNHKGLSFHNKVILNPS